MIAYLRGKLLEVTTDTAVIDVQGVGYETLCSGRTLDQLRMQVGQELRLWIYTHVREDALQLFGFGSRQEKEVFLSLLKVNGVGPKSALSILSGAEAEKIIGFIEAGDAKALSNLPKIGKKTASIKPIIFSASAPDKIDKALFGPTPFTFKRERKTSFS